MIQFCFAAQDSEQRDPERLHSFSIESNLNIGFIFKMKAEEAQRENDSAFSVYVRVRPLNSAERSLGTSTIRTEGNQIFVRDPGPFSDYAVIS